MGYHVEYKRGRDLSYTKGEEAFINREDMLDFVRRYRDRIVSIHETTRTDITSVVITQIDDPLGKNVGR